MDTDSDILTTVVFSDVFYRRHLEGARSKDIHSVSLHSQFLLLHPGLHTEYIPSEENNLHLILDI